MNKNDVLQYLKNNYDQLTGSQKIIGKYVLDNYREVAFLSAIELGEKVGVSDATIIRFAQSIGFSGFAEFRSNIRDGIKNFDLPHKRLSKNLEIINDKNNLTMQVGKKDLKNLEEFLLHIDVEKIKQATDAICRAGTIYLVGIGSSGVLVDFLALHFRRMGFKVMAVSEGGVVNVEKIMSIAAKDLLIACSFPRYSKPTYQAINFAKKRKAKVITITDSNFSTVSIHSDIVFSLPIENATFFNSYIVPMELCNMLIISILENDKERIYTSLEENIQSLEIFDLRL